MPTAAAAKVIVGCNGTWTACVRQRQADVHTTYDTSPQIQTYISTYDIHTHTPTHAGRIDPWTISSKRTISPSGGILMQNTYFLISVHKVYYVICDALAAAVFVVDGGRKGGLLDWERLVGFESGRNSRERICAQFVVLQYIVCWPLDTNLHKTQQTSSTQLRVHTIE